MQWLLPKKGWTISSGITLLNWIGVLVFDNDVFEVIYYIYANVSDVRFNATRWVMNDGWSDNYKEWNISSESDKLFLAKDSLEGSISLTSGADEPGDGDKVGLAEVDGAIFIDLNVECVTSQTESCMEAWSLEVMILSVKSHFLGR